MKIHTKETQSPYNSVQFLTQANRLKYSKLQFLTTLMTFECFSKTETYLA